MRLDVFLKRVGLIRQRSLAKETCERGLVTVDGAKAKAAKEIRIGNVIGVHLPDEYLELEITGLPNRNCKRGQGEVFYRVIRREAKDRY